MDAMANGTMATNMHHEHGTSNSTMTPGRHSQHSQNSNGHQLYFYLGNEAIILFLQWTTHDWRSLVYSCIGIVIVAALYEGLKNFRGYLMHFVRQRQAYTKSCCTALCTGMHVLQTFLHIVQVAVSYGLMLVFMTFNGWLCISILAGAGIGYLIFGWRRHSHDDPNEHCN